MAVKDSTNLHLRALHEFLPEIARGHGWDTNPLKSLFQGKYRKRKGRMPDPERRQKKQELFDLLEQHPTLRDAPQLVATLIGVSESTVRRWIEKCHQKYVKSSVARAAPRYDE